MIKLKNLLQEGAIDRAAVDFLSQMVKKSKWKGKVFLAGGYVRDELLGLDPKDVDIVIEFPQGGIKFAEWITKKLGVYKKGSNPVIYPKFGTAAFRLQGVNHKGYDLSKIEIEAVMTRKEQYHAGSRKPDVSPGTLKDDVERRDFTVNSLLKDLSTGEILDLTGMGKSDLRKGVIRTALDPDVIFKEDPLRMLRAIRFAVKYGWTLPMFMIKALKRNSHMLKTISEERIMTELNKMLVSKSPDKAIRILQMTGLNKYVAGELDALRGLEQNKYHKFDALKHTLEVLKNTPPELETRLAALFHDIGKVTAKKVIDSEVHFYEHEDVSAEMAEAILRRLKYPMDVIKKVVAAVKNHMRTKQYGGESEGISDKTIRKLKRDLGDHLKTTLDLIHADNISHAEDYNMPMQIPKLKDRLKSLEHEPTKPKLPVNGNDVMKHLKIKPGPVLKILLQQVEDAYFENPGLTKKQALAIVKRAYKIIEK
jgi:poly(A) polymerase